MSVDRTKHSKHCFTWSVLVLKKSWFFYWILDTIIHKPNHELWQNFELLSFELSKKKSVKERRCQVRLGHFGNHCSPTLYLTVKALIFIVCLHGIVWLGEQWTHGRVLVTKGHSRVVFTSLYLWEMLGAEKKHLEVIWLVRTQANKHSLFNSIIIENLLIYKSKRLQCISQTK